jgi:hypothetical protein
LQTRNLLKNEAKKPKENAQRRFGRPFLGHETYTSQFRQLLTTFILPVALSGTVFTSELTAGCSI